MEGLLLVDKPLGLSSFEIVRRVRKLANTRKVGHTGTLDPDATGLLPIALGRCTKLAKFLQLDTKEYVFEVSFGEETDSDDATGEVVDTCAFDHVTEHGLREKLADFVGEVMQVPPRFSAVHIQGKRAYQLAREGVDFELPARPVQIDSIEVESLEGLPGKASLRMTCGSGTYVRSLARDLGRALDSCAHASVIRRTRVGDFSIEDAHELSEFSGPEDLEPSLLSPARMLSSIPSQHLTELDFGEIRHGRPILAADHISAGDDVALLLEGKLAAVGEVVEHRSSHIVKPRKVFMT